MNKSFLFYTALTFIISFSSWVFSQSIEDLFVCHPDPERRARPGKDLLGY